jgi:HAMP domain-containing protein
MKIAHKFLLTFAAIVFLVAITVLAFVYKSYNGLLENQIRGKLLAVSSYAMEKIDRSLYRKYEDLAALAADPVVCSETSSPARITKKLLEFKRHFNAYLPYDSLTFLDLTGKRIAGTGENDDGMCGMSAGARPEIGKRDFVLSVSNSQPTGEAVFCLAMVVKDRKGDPRGLVVSKTPVEDLKRLADRPLGLFGAGLTPYMDLVDRNGLILYSNHNRQGILKATVPGWETIRKARSSGAARGSVILRETGKNNVDDIVIYAGGEGHARLGTNEWTLVTALPKKAAFASVLEMRNKVVALIFLLWLVALSVAYVLSRTITKPIILLSNAAAEVGKGNRDISVSIDSNDEVGQLGRSFNSMVENLGRTEREREKLVAELRDALATIKTLQGILPICSSCKKIRDDEGYWNHLETYISKHTDAVFSHGLCTDCAKKLYPRHFREEKRQ